MIICDKLGLRCDDELFNIIKKKADRKALF